MRELEGKAPLSQRLPLIAASLALALGALGVIFAEGDLPIAPEMRERLVSTGFSSEAVLEERGRDFSGAGDKARATAIYRELLRRDSANAYRWCDLADALLAEGNKAEADRCYRRAAQLGPRIPTVLMRTGNFYFGTDRRAEAEPHYRAVLELVRDYDWIIFVTLDQMGLTAKDVLSRVLPANKEAGDNYMQFVTARGQEADAPLVWQFLRSHAFLDDSAVGRYIDFWLRRGKGEAAVKAWAAHLGKDAKGYLSQNWVFNGGFERSPRGVATDWRIDQLEGAESSIDNLGGSKDGRCLRIRFLGKKNLDYQQVRQSIWLPTGDWTLRVRVKYEALTTNQGPQFRLSDPSGKVNWHSDVMTGTQDWRWLTATFSVPDNVPSLSLAVVRVPSEKFDNKIEGTIWIDDVRISR